MLLVSHLVLEEQLQHLHVLVVDGHEQRGPAQPIRDQYCDILTNHSSPAQRVHAVHVDHGGRVLQHPDIIMELYGYMYLLFYYLLFIYKYLL